MDQAKSPLLTDLYQLTMLQAYLEAGMADAAVFEFYIRKLPQGRNFLLAAGLGPALEYLAGMRFSEGEIDYLSGTGRFSRAVLEYLEDFRFTGDVHALPEGTVFFPGEPLLRVTAPITAAQLVESRIINIMHLHTIIASKAARCRLAASPSTLLVDFGMRRAHGAEAAMAAARSSYIAGFAGSSTVLAGQVYGIPVFGTMAHSFIEAHTGELQAFLDFSRANPGNTTMLVDTYDTVGGALRTVEAARQLAGEGIKISAVRLDSGELLQLSLEVRKALDAGGFPDIRIFASGDIDEYAIRDLLSKGAPIDGFGVGTKMDTSADAPYLECAYKLMEYAGVPRLKKSAAKATLPGRKQVFRVFRGGVMEKDVICLEGEKSGGTPLLRVYMQNGRIVEGLPTLGETARYAAGQVASLPDAHKSLGTAPPYPVQMSARLADLKAEAERRIDQISSR